MRPKASSRFQLSTLTRIRIWYGLLLLLLAFFIVRLFYLQVIRHSYYQQAALTKQLKEYQIPAERGIIVAQNGDGTVPIVLNETKYTLYADPVYVEDAHASAEKIAEIIGGNAVDYEKQLKADDTRYVVLAKRLDEATKTKLDALDYKGIGTREASYRTYPQGTLGAQLLGFVNDEGEGKYGVEQALDEHLRGTPGEIRAITDAQGVPLAGNEDNIIRQPVKGEKVVLTIDLGMQRQLEDILKKGLEDVRSDFGSALIMEAKTGAIKAMANYPTYDPSKFYEVKDAEVFNNGAVSRPLEVGSIMKPLTLAAALDLGVVSANSSYYDPGSFTIDGATITNVIGGSGTRTVGDILRLSLNTGAAWLLMQMGGGEINEQARVRWYDYMTNHYRFGQLTGIEQGYEAPGSIPSPTEGFGLDIQYANTSFGQGMTATPLQMGAALASVINGGTYYQPRLVESYITQDGTENTVEPKILDDNVVKPEVGEQLRSLMEYSFNNNYLIYGMKQLRSDYAIGGKTGTAQVTRPEGGYYDDRFNGTFMGYVGGNEPEYVIVVRLNAPGIAGYAGSQAAGPIFSNLTNMLIDNFGVTPKD